MRTGNRVSRLVTAVLVGAAGLLFYAAGPAVAGPEDPRAEAWGDSRRARSGGEYAAASSGVATDNSAICAKCHSACENGRNHIGLAPTGEQAGAAFPLDAAGRTTCVTCHDSRDHGARGVTGDHLRISNLRRELCLACHQPDAGDLPRIEIVSPLERTVVQDERLALIGRAPQLSGSDLTVRLNGSEFHLQVKAGEFSTWLMLRDGINRIEVARDERLLWKGEVFFGESSLGSYELTSSGHRTENRAQCRECHLKKDEIRSQVTATSQALCYGCHDRVDEKRFVHGPLAVGDCLACHDPHGGYGTAHLRQEQTQLCGNCHAARQNVAKTACKASAGKGCVDCHDPHQSDVRYLLKGHQYTMR